MKNPMVHFDVCALCAGGEKTPEDAAGGEPEAQDGDKPLRVIIKEILVPFFVAVKKLV